MKPGFLTVSGWNLLSLYILGAGEGWGAVEPKGLCRSRGTDASWEQTHTHIDTHKARRARAGKRRGERREKAGKRDETGSWRLQATGRLPCRARGRGTKPSAGGSLGCGRRGPPASPAHPDQPSPGPGTRSRACTHPPSSRAAPGPAGRAARRPGRAWCSGPSCPRPRQPRGRPSRCFKAASAVRPRLQRRGGSRDGDRGPPREGGDPSARASSGGPEGTTRPDLPGGEGEAGRCVAVRAMRWAVLG